MRKSNKIMQKIKKKSLDITGHGVNGTIFESDKSVKDWFFVLTIFLMTQEFYNWLSSLKKQSKSLIKKLHLNLNNRRLNKLSYWEKKIMYKKIFLSWKNFKPKISKQIYNLLLAFKTDKNPFKCQFSRKIFKIQSKKVKNRWKILKIYKDKKVCKDKEALELTPETKLFLKISLMSRKICLATQNRRVLTRFLLKYMNKAMIIMTFKFKLMNLEICTWKKL